MKSHLTKISLAVLSTVFLLGCQDLGTGVVESDGLGPAFAPKEGKGKPKPPPGQVVLARLTMGTPAEEGGGGQHRGDRRGPAGDTQRHRADPSGGDRDGDGHEQ